MQKYGSHTYKKSLHVKCRLFLWFWELSYYHTACKRKWFAYVRIIGYCHERFWCLTDCRETFLPWEARVTWQSGNTPPIVHHGDGYGIEFGTWKITLLFGCPDCRVNRLQNLGCWVTRHSYLHVGIDLVELIAKTAHKLTIAVIRFVVPVHRIIDFVCP